MYEASSHMCLSRGTIGVVHDMLSHIHALFHANCIYFTGNDRWREGRTRLGYVLGQIQNGFPTRTAALQMVGPKHHHLHQCSDIQAFYTFNSIIQLRSHA